MPISAEQLSQVARLTLAAPSVREAALALRESLPGLRISTVDALDMRNEQPAVNLGTRQLYLMESDGHCWSVTRDPALAQAIVLTETS